MEKTKIILDVDTGSDDAIAIITALLSEELDVLGITTVNGNQPLANTTENTLRVIDAIGSKVPVYKGCSKPLVSELIPDRHARLQPTQKIEIDGEVIQYHGAQLDLPPSVSKIQDKSAVCFIVDTVMASGNDIVLVPVGPLTNIAAAMRAEPRIIPKIKKIVLMGGGHRVMNRTSASEFNIWKDPEAAQIVVTSDCEVVIVPLDATHAGYVTGAESDEFRAIGTPAALAVSDLLDERIKAYDALQPMEIAGTTPPHDALAVCAVIDPTVLQDVRYRRIDVDFSGGVCDGMTMVDERVINEFPKNAYIALDCDREKFVDMMRQRLLKNRISK